MQNLDLSPEELQLTDAINAEIDRMYAEIDGSDITDELLQPNDDEIVELANEITETVKDKTLEAFQEIEPDPDEPSNQALITAGLVAGFFVRKILSEAANRIRSAWQARQLFEDDREESLEQALSRSKQLTESMVVSEIGVTSFDYESAIAQGNGYSYYRYITSGDDVVRDKHSSRDGKIFKYGAARVADDIPKNTPNCRCESAVLTDEEAIADGNFYYPEDAPLTAKVQKLDLKFRTTSFGAIGDIGDWWTATDFEGFKHQSEEEVARTGKLHIDMSSIGGLYDDGAAMYSYVNQLKERGIEVIFNVVGYCASAATFPMVAATKATADISDRIMIHQATGGYIGNSPEGFDAAKKQTENANIQMAEMYRRKNGRPIDEILALMREDRYMSAQEALDFGLIDEIRGQTPESTSPPSEGFFYGDDYMSDEKNKGSASSDHLQEIGALKAKVAETEAIANEAKASLEAAEAANDVLKAKAESTKTEEEIQADIDAGVAAGIEQYKTEQSELAATQEKVEALGVEAKGDTVDELRKSALLASGVTKAEGYNSLQLQAAFDTLDSAATTTGADIGRAIKAKGEKPKATDMNARLAALGGDK